MCRVLHVDERSERRASSGQFFPQFSAQDFLLEPRRESASQTLKLRFVDVSPIAPVHENVARQYSSHGDQELLADAMSPGRLESSSPSSPSVAESFEAALLRSGDEEFQTPRPSARSQRVRSGELRGRRSEALRDLDVSMHSLNLSDDGVMILANNNGDDDNVEAQSGLRSEHNRGAPAAEDRGLDSVGSARELHDQVPKVLYFSSDSEDEAMDYEFGDRDERGDNDDEQGEAMDLTHDDPDPDADGCVEATREAPSVEAVAIKAEPESEDVVLLGVMPAPATLTPIGTTLERASSHPNVVNASRESCDSVDSNQGTDDRTDSSCVVGGALAPICRG